MAQTWFKEVTEITGISYVGQSYGGAWGDVNEDTRPDLWLTNHYDRDILYLNQGDGTFTDATSEILLEERRGDTHGAAWADFDNDGDQDLVQLVGAKQGLGSGSNRLYVNTGKKLEDRASTLAPELHLAACCCVGCQELVDRAEELGVDYPQNRGRTPLWYDYNKDGRLDLVVTGLERPDGEAPTTIFRQTNEEKFVDAGTTTGWEVSSSAYAQLSDLSRDGNIDLFITGRIYDTTSIPFEDLSATLLPNIPGFVDAAIADFNGDLLSDLYLPRNGLRPSGLHRDSSSGFRTSLSAGQEPDGVQFKTTGDVTFKLNHFAGGGANPTSFEFTLSPDNPTNIPETAPGIDISYDPTLERWQLLLSRTEEKNNLSAIVRATESISELTAIGFDDTKLPNDDQLLINTGQGFINKSQEAQINSVPTASKNVVAGDFDNDMDVDIYIVTSEAAGNLPNVLYENQGDGTFAAVPDAGGAAGSTLGVAGEVMSADYNLDGFLDLLVTNGEGPPLLNNDGPAQLFQNQGNDNHWLEIDLEGVKSNRDGIGARVFVTAGGVTQLREQSGGMHHRSQNHQRIHFGLAENTIVDELVVQWPSGKEQRIENIPADQLIRVIEPSGSFSLGKPEYKVGEDEGVFLWQDTPDGTYHLRVNGGGCGDKF